MTIFNENPFKRNTAVVPFSNATESEGWKNNNCYQCIKYEDESKEEEDANCKLAFHLDMGSIIGTIPLWAAKGIGCDYDPLYQICTLSDRCNELRKEDEPF